MVELIKEIFGEKYSEPGLDEFVAVSNERGGKAAFLPSAEKDLLANAIDLLLPCPDVHINTVGSLDQRDALHRPLLGVDEYRGLPPEKLGMFSYIHKQKDGKDIYFFANSTDSFVETDVRLKGKLSLEIWNPYTGDLGKEIPVKYEIGNDNIVYTTFRLQLSPVKSIFIIGDK